MHLTPTLQYPSIACSLSAMTRLNSPGLLVDGRATPEGTRRFRKRFARTQPDHFYRPIANGSIVSSRGFGTYLGECDDTEHARYTTTVSAALQNGVNLLDTAINYRCQRSERVIGVALRDSTLIVSI